MSRRVKQEALKPKSRRIVELDVLRALAAINLVLFHFTHVYSVKYGYSSPLGFEFSFGKYGVAMFFVLSGFVNALTITRKRQPGEFVAARIIRIFPSYYLAIALNLVLLTMMPLAGYHDMYTTGQVAANMTVMPSLFGQEFLEPVTWTLQIEMLFYGLVLIMFVSGSFRNPLPTVLWFLCLCVAAVCSLDYLIAIGANPQVIAGMDFVRQLLILDHLPLFCIGILIHEIWRKNGTFFWNAIGIVASVVVLHLIDKRDYNPLATVLIIGVLFLAAYGKMPFLRLKSLVFVSTISYSLYLLHNNLGCVFIHEVDKLGVPPLVTFGLAIVFTTVVSTIATFWVERPISNWLKRCWAAAKQASWLQTWFKTAATLPARALPNRIQS